MRRGICVEATFAVVLAASSCVTYGQEVGKPADADGGRADDGAVVVTPPDDAGSSPDANVDSGARCSPTAPFGDIEPVNELNTADREVGARLTPDELTIFFVRWAGPRQEILTASRATPSGVFGPASSVVEVCTNEVCGYPSPSTDGTTLWYSNGTSQLLSLGKTAGGSWQASAPLGGSEALYSPFVAADGKVIFAATLEGSQLSIVSVDPSTWSKTTVLPAAGGGEPFAPVVSSDGLTLFVSLPLYSGGGGLSNKRIFVAKRTSTSAPFPAAQIAAELLSAGGSGPGDEPSWLSPDGCVLYFSSGRSVDAGSGSANIWRARRGM